MTYYELISFLDNIIYEPRSNEKIDILNKSIIDLKGDRYFRFIDQVSYMVQERLYNSLDKIEEKILMSNIKINEFTLELNELIEDINYCKRIGSINIINEENKKSLLKTIDESTNNILKELKTYFSENAENEAIFNLIDRHMVKEN